VRRFGKGFRGGFGGGVIFVKFVHSVFCLLLESFPPRKSCVTVMWLGGG